MSKAKNFFFFFFLIKTIYFPPPDNNFEWVGEAMDGRLLCVWEEDVLAGSCQAGSDAATLATCTHVAEADRDLQSVQVKTKINDKSLNRFSWLL